MHIDTLRKHVYYSRDYVPTVLLETWPLAATMWDGEELGGPVPTMFAVDGTAALANMLKAPGRLHGDLMKFGRLFGVVEHVEMAKAVQIIKKPR